MTIYAVMNEAGSWVASDANTAESTTSGMFDSAYARASILNDGASTFARGCVFSSLTAGYIRAFKIRESTASIASYFLYGMNSSGIGALRLVGQNDTVWVEYYNGSAWTVATTAVPSTLTARTAYDIYFSGMGTASGLVRLYVNDTLSATSSTLNFSSTPNVASVWTNGGFGTGDQHASEVVVADVPTIGWRVATLYITGAGTTNTFDSGTYADVDETVYSTADFISSGTNNQIFLGACNDYSVGSGTIKAVAVSALAKKGASGLANINLAVRAGGSNAFSADKALDVGVGAFQNIWETNPTTAVAWVAADIAATEIGVRSRT